ncbi:hypothetical protein ACF05L_22110 [Streptomyces bobili]|uniref:hypothetical protein n=1 Tax=Streptomyces bobili TaxID=67280 RepID=UPI0036F9AE5D
MQGDHLGRVADGQGLLDPAGAEAVAGDEADGGAGRASGGAPGLVSRIVRLTIDDVTDDETTVTVQ